MINIKSFIFSVLGILLVLSLDAQTITCRFSNLANQQIKLIGFNGFDTYTIASTKANVNGEFNMKFNRNDYGMGYLIAENDQPFILVLSEENIALAGETFTNPEGVIIQKSKNNQLFAQYALEHPRREQVLSAWDYLLEIYRRDNLFSVHPEATQIIFKEKQRINSEDSLFLTNLNNDSYLSWYLPIRKLVSSVSVVAQYRTEEISATIAAFQKLDYTDPKFYKSGLVKDVLDSHVWLIENSGRSLDSVFVELNKSIDSIVANLSNDEEKLNEITEYIFKLLEKRSLFRSSEYLALKLLNQQGCTLNNDFANQLESYRAMKIGNIAPDIEFIGEVLFPNSKIKPNRLYDLHYDYTVIIFGASWCPACQSELEIISNIYDKWKAQGIEVVFVSLDETFSNFNNFASKFPFISTCDYEKWNSQAVQDYYVFATPTIYLVDESREIILRPSSVKQMDAWVDWYLLEGK